MVAMVAEGEDTVAFRLCSCSSTLESLERGLEGALTDLRWQAIFGIDALKLPGSTREKENRSKASCCNGVFRASASLFI
jgi:hypothetical protein